MVELSVFIERDRVEERMSAGRPIGKGCISL
jgi:hypothetical protein